MYYIGYNLSNTIHREQNIFQEHIDGLSHFLRKLGWSVYIALESIVNYHIFSNYDHQGLGNDKLAKCFPPKHEDLSSIDP